MLPIVDYEVDTVNECRPFNFGLTLFCYGCNMHCKMCDGYDYERVTCKDNIIGDAVSILEKQITPLHEVVVFLGGEMLIHKEELYKALEWCHERGLKTKIFTNGMLPDRVEYINSKGLCDSWSVDYKAVSVERCKEELAVDGQDYFSKLFTTLTNILENKLPLEIRTTFYSGNNELEEFTKKYMNELVGVFKKKYMYDDVRFIVQHDFRKFI